LAAVIVSLTALALLAPASSEAATTIGKLDPVPNGGTCQAGNVYLETIVDTIGFPGLRYTVPAGGGVITSWGTRPDATGGQRAALKTLRDNGPTVTVLGASVLQDLTPSVPNSFPTRIPVGGGESIGYAVPAGSTSQACYDTQTNSNDGVKAGPDPSPGNVFTVDNDSTQRRLNLTATIEADTDRDGFGDETQDRCPGALGTNAGCPIAGLPGGGGADKTKPSLGGLRFSSSTFKAAKSGGAFSAQKKGKKKSSAPTGTKVSYTLSEAASVRFTVQRKTSGRRSSGKCRKKTRKNAKKPRCTLWKKVTGSFTVPGKAGKNTFTFRGRIGGKALRAGSYRLNGTAKDPSKNASVPKRKGFRIVK
jgi:hypothetical protein